MHIYSFGIVNFFVLKMSFSMWRGGSRITRVSSDAPCGKLSVGAPHFLNGKILYMLKSKR